MRFAVNAIAFVLAATRYSASALSDADIASVFGSSATGLTGNSIELPQFVYSVVTNSTHGLFTLNATSAGPSSVGWMATALGTAMANGDFLITWPTVSSNTVQWTLSHRKTIGYEGMPVLAAATGSADATSELFHYIEHLSTTEASSSYTAVSYVRELQFPSSLSQTLFQPYVRGSNNILYASCTISPDSTDEGATITQHNQAHAATTIDLSPTITLSGQTTSTTSSGTSPFNGGSQKSVGWTKRDMILIAHGTIASLAFLVFMPFGIYIARFFRAYTWFPAHRAMQIFTAILVIIAFALGTNADSGPDDTHTMLGTALFALVLFQVVLGFGSHYVKRKPQAPATLPTLTQSHPVRLFHVLVGIVILALGFWNVHEGFSEWQEYNSLGKPTPRGVYIAFWIWLAIVWVVYLAGWVLEPMRHKPVSPDNDKTVEKVGSH